MAKVGVNREIQDGPIAKAHLKLLTRTLKRYVSSLVRLMNFLTNELLRLWDTECVYYL